MLLLINLSFYQIIVGLYLTPVEICTLVPPLKIQENILDENDLNKDKYVLDVRFTPTASLVIILIRSAFVKYFGNHTLSNSLNLVRAPQKYKSESVGFFMKEFWRVRK